MDEDIAQNIKPKYQNMLNEPIPRIIDLIKEAMETVDVLRS